MSLARSCRASIPAPSHPVAECPVEAIFAEDDVPADQKEFIALNAELAKGWKPIVERKDAPADADEWKGVKDKKGLIER